MEQAVNPMDMMDPRQAFAMLQDFHGMEMARLAGDIATKNTFIMMLQRELQAAQERITAFEQNQEAAKEANGNGAIKGGADLSKFEQQPTAPPALARKVRDNPQA